MNYYSNNFSTARAPSMADLVRMARGLEEARRRDHAAVPDLIDFGRESAPRRLRIVHLGDRSGAIDRFAAHPRTIVEVEAIVGRGRRDGDRYDTFFGIPLHEDHRLPRHPRKWATATHPWVEYDDADAAWSRPIGYGQLEEDRDTLLMVACHKLDWLKRVMELPPCPNFADKCYLMELDLYFHTW